MTQALSSKAEQLASQAQKLKLFSRFNLLGVKEDLALFLSQFGREGIFSQYTTHDITHVDTLLGMLDWIVPGESAAIMTPVDWMLSVLGIYFHDAGLVVTKSEFDKRNGSNFPFFKDQIMGSVGQNPYKEHVESLEPSERERFLYQEFVRTNHAERIRLWIAGQPSTELGVACESANAVSRFLSQLDPNFRNDLALICESHHRDDLADLEKYNPRRAYGNDLPETANLQYAALLLRTVDLLHITKDRAPSLAFRLISPSDPKSIEEWHKQMEVVAVRESPRRDERGNVDKEAIADTIAVSATFHDPLGFFSLTEYLHYAEQQLKLSSQWAEQAATRESFAFRFPWRKIDSTQVKAVGFASKQFSFELDKARLLKLLTGHTLYSNSNVVVRELIQNSLDAIRLQKRMTGRPGKIELSLDTKRRILTIDDNGTGMTQQVIENHFLNVGSSRYGDDSFRRQHPDFSAISRFGIGILSTFMISDEIEVITKDTAEKEARNLSIRSLNGKYLIRMVDPSGPNFPTLLRNHGTRIQLKLRAGVKVPALQQVAQLWILFPGCEITVSEDEALPVRIGYASPKQALEQVLTAAGYPIASSEPEGHDTVYRVVEGGREGLRLAYAVRWQPSYRNWSLMRLGEFLTPHQPQMQIPTAICIHGVRVENMSPGFAAQEPLAISDITGPHAPATNVARSNLESGSAVDEMFSSVYSIYAAHIISEIHAMQKQRGLSLSTAASEGRYLAFQLQSPLPSGQCPEAKRLLNAQLKTIPWLTLDKNDMRSLVSVADLDKSTGFWTIESGAYASAEDFLRRVPSTVSLSRLTNFLDLSDLVPDGPIVGGFSESTLVRDLISEEFEVDRIELYSEKRQAHLHWRALAAPPIWRSATPDNEGVAARVGQIVQQFSRNEAIRYRSLVLQTSDELEVKGVAGECGFRGRAKLYLFSGSSIHKMLAEALEALAGRRIEPAAYAFALLAANVLAAGEEVPQPKVVKHLENLAQEISGATGTEISVSHELRVAANEVPHSFFDPMRDERNIAWSSWTYRAGVD